ncbi:hypothetical protein ACQKM9_13890 [Viridibacillus sp. NPDC093762]|uniref:hypothetical protein n=1 Tax=Viridibacillus sp. NPDC093762 TaxID=3390720 RepID=UPI003D011967
MSIILLNILFAKNFISSTYFELKIHPGFVDACNEVFDEISTQIIPYHVEPEQFISAEEVIIVKQLIELFKQQKNDNIQTELIFNPEPAPMRPSVIVKEFNGRLQGTTLQLYAEVWRELDDFVKKYQLSKKAVVNQAIWEYLEKWIR